MKKAIFLRLVIVVAVLLTASVASADVTWTRPVASGAGDFADSANWSAVPDPLTDRYYFMGTAAANGDIEVTGAQSYGLQLVLGHTYPASSEAPLLTIKSGGSLSQGVTTTGRHSYVGRSNIGHMIIEAGGTFSTPAKLYIGTFPGSTGTVDVYGTLDLSAGSGKLNFGDTAGSSSTGTLNIYDGGVVKMTTFRDTYNGFELSALGANASINIYGSGYMIDPGADTLSYAELILAAGILSGDGVPGNVVAVYDGTDTIIKVNPEPPAQDLYPGDGDTVPIANPLALSWAIPIAYDGKDVYVEVWSGTDPAALTAEPNYPPDYLSPVTTVPGDGLNVTTADIDGSDEGTYYWRVDMFINGTDLSDANNVHVEGGVMSFDTISDLPPTVTIETVDTMTWSDEAVALAATITDDAASTLTYGWTAVPDGISDPDLNIDFSPGAGDEDPTVTITNTTGSMVSVMLTLTADDESNDPVEASVTIEVYNNACDMTINGGVTPVAPTDINADCTTDIADLAEMAAAFLVDYAETGPVPQL